MFQSTHPSRGATVQIDIPLAPLLVSIHAPLAGCDIDDAGAVLMSACFNPRTPRGVRQNKPESEYHKIGFNPRTPRGVRLWYLRIGEGILEFQSTHPSRGATQITKY